MNVDGVSRESELWRALGQNFLAGYTETRYAPVIRRHGRAIRRHLEAQTPPPYCESWFVPSGAFDLWGQPGQYARFDYSYSLTLNGAERVRVLQAIDELPDAHDRQLLQRSLGEIETCAHNPLSPRFCLGGNGFTHSILNYRRILEEGLSSYRTRIEVAMAAKPTPQEDFYAALLDVMEGIAAFHASLLKSLENQPTPHSPKLSALIQALHKVPRQPAGSFYEALVAFMFVLALDSCDSIGRFDQTLSPYYDADIEAGRITEATAAEMLTEIWRHFDANNGWHMVLGGTRADGEAFYSPFTRLCLQTLHGQRRPNTGLRVRPDMPQALWDDLFDCLLSGSGNPSLYNETAYFHAINQHTGVLPADQTEFAFGGCTELMFDGFSNVGSIDAGIHLLDILSATVQESLTECDSFEEFLDVFHARVQDAVDAVTDEVNLNQMTRSIHRPQLIRSLFVDDCIERGVEYHAGGARFNGSVINVVGVANTINALETVRRLYRGEIALDRPAFLRMLAANYQGYERIHQQILSFPKYGNAAAELDALGARLIDFVFSQILAKRCWRGNGIFMPATILFVTYVELGRGIPATPDGRQAGEPIADSVGPMQGTDLSGPTAMLLSASMLPHAKGLGTLVLNLRINASFLKSPAQRAKIRDLIRGYFSLGGLQIQVTVTDRAQLQEAIEYPEKYPNLIIRIGGYTEYFNRLERSLQQEVLRRTEYSG